MTKLSFLSDDELLSLTREGKSDAFDEFVSRRANQVYNLALNLTGFEEEAHDIAHQVFLTVHDLIKDGLEIEVDELLHRVTYDMALGSLINRIAGTKPPKSDTFSLIQTPLDLSKAKNFLDEPLLVDDD